LAAEQEVGSNVHRTVSVMRLDVQQHVMIWSQLALLPQSSVAVQVRVMTFGHVPFATSFDVRVMCVQLSLTVGVPVMLASGWSAQAPSDLTQKKSLQVITGLVMSTVQV